MVDGRLRPLIAGLVLSAALAAVAGERSLVLFDDFETRDARFWSASLPEMPDTVCTPAATPVPLSDPVILGNGSPGSVTRAQIQAALDDGGNLQWPPTRPNGQTEEPATATVVWADPLLLPIGDYGGISETMPPGDLSPALGGGVSGGAPPADQRGRARTVPIDIGAYENP